MKSSSANNKTINDFKFSQRSINNLENVDSDLVDVAHLALEFTQIDFGITEGLRTESEQRKLVESGKSQTMNSKHLNGLAIDVAAYIGSDISWDIEYYIEIAEAFKKAAIELNVNIRWGGSWQILNNERSAKVSYHNYVQLRRSQNRKPFVDAVHYEIIKE